MTTRISVIAASLGLASLATALHAEKQPEAPVPVTVIKTVPATQPEARPENQRLYGPTNATVIPVEQAQALVSRFKEAYVKLGSPRIVFCINRDLVDNQSGVKLTGRTERYEQTQSTLKSDVEKTSSSSQKQETQAAAGNTQPQVNVYVDGKASSGHGLPQGKTDATITTSKTSGENTYAVKEGAQLTLADKQTMREIERLFGRVFRASGASIADAKAAASLLEDKPVSNLTGTNDQAAKDREALGKVADVAIEILVSTRAVTTPAVSGDQVMNIPDVQVTAIRLQDAAILGQASSSDILGKDRNAAQVARNFDVREITEATALALMEDMMSHLK